MATHPIGKRYDGGTFDVLPGMGLAYAEATDDPHPAYRGEHAVTPPMFHVRPFIELMMQCATDPELKMDLLRLVHGEHAMQFHRPLQEGDTLRREGELLAVDDKASGTTYTFALRGYLPDSLAMAGTTTYFVRKPSTGPKGPKKPAPAVEEAPPPSWICEQRVTADQADRYAKASGDHNPIHVDANVAKAAGLPGVILHGLCTLAFAQRDLIARYAPADPSRLRAIRVRFAGTVFPGDTLTLSVWEDGDNVRFQTTNAAGKTVLSGGTAEFA